MYYACFGVWCAGALWGADLSTAATAGVRNRLVWIEAARIGRMTEHCRTTRAARGLAGAGIERAELH